MASSAQQRACYAGQEALEDLQSPVKKRPLHAKHTTLRARLQKMGAGPSKSLALLSAASQGDLRSVQELLAAKDTNVNAGDQARLRDAAWGRADAGPPAKATSTAAEAGLSTQDGWRALHAAASAGHCEVVQELLAHSAELDCRENVSAWAWSSRSNS